MSTKKIEYDWATTATSLQEIVSKRVADDARWRLVAVMPMKISYGSAGVSGDAEGFAAWFEWER